MATDPNPYTTPASLSSRGYTSGQPMWQVPVQTDQHYANHIEIERGEHDAVLRFYRTRGNGKSLVREITVPLTALDHLAGGQK